VPSHSLKTGFWLIELLVAIGILGILVAVLLQELGELWGYSRV
jgi:prepilin-type N-terminal cleavage/methylation domain-containing protein